MVRFPIIIIGMHRSGTTLLTRLLEGCGLFIGQDSAVHGESMFFQKQNEWLLRQNGATWDAPAAFEQVLDHAALRARIGDYLRFLLRTRHTAAYLGWRRYLRDRGIVGLDRPWGWKDPRNTITLPIWLDLFPEARVIHMYRHGVDSAQSLRMRYTKRLRLKEETFWKYHIRPKQGRFTNVKVSQTSLAACFELWMYHRAIAERHLAAWDGPRLEIRYESFLQEPAGVLREAAAFCSLQPTAEIVDGLAQNVDGSRAFAYRDDPALCAFAAEVRDQLRVYGYDEELISPLVE